MRFHLGSSSCGTDVQQRLQPKWLRKMMMMMMTLGGAVLSGAPRTCNTCCKNDPAPVCLEKTSPYQRYFPDHIFFSAMSCQRGGIGLPSVEHGRNRRDTTKIQRKDPQRGKKRTNFAAGEEKKSKILGLPPFGPPLFLGWAPTLRTPTLRPTHPRQLNTHKKKPKQLISKKNPPKNKILTYN